MNGEDSYLDYLKFGGETATGLVGALTQKEKTIVQQAPASSPNNWTMIAIIGGAVLALVVIVVVALKK
jgi:hypothetical protein